MGYTVRILKKVKETPRLSPKLLSDELKMPLQTVRNILTSLTELNLVYRRSRGIYEITQIGNFILTQLEYRE